MSLTQHPPVSIKISIKFKKNKIIMGVYISHCLYKAMGNVEVDAAVQPYGSRNIFICILCIKGLT
jgi:hypothetical protein